MKVKKRREVEITIIMDESEAKWLKEFMQIHLINTEDEDKQDKKMKQMFWSSLDAEGINL